MDGLGNQEVSRKKGENHENRLPALRWEEERESDRERESKEGVGKACSGDEIKNGFGRKRESCRQNDKGLLPVCSKQEENGMNLPHDLNCAPQTRWYLSFSSQAEENDQGIVLHCLLLNTANTY